MHVDHELAAFVASLARAAPAADLPALRGEWELAHDAVQPETAECAWVHAALHREEGDRHNADYWYRQAGRTAPMATTRDEYLAIAAALLRQLGRSG